MQIIKYCDGSLKMVSANNKKYSKYSNAQSFNLLLTYMYFICIFFIWSMLNGGETMLYGWFVFAPLMMGFVTMIPAFFIWKYIIFRVKKCDLHRNNQDIITSLFITIEAYLLVGFLISIPLFFFNVKIFALLIFLSAIAAIFGCLNSWFFSFLLPR